MPSPFHGIDTVSRALMAFQRGLDVAGHNIANVNTKGFSRQTVDYSATDPASFYGLTRLTLGSGVGISAVTRAQDLFLQGRMLSAQADLSRQSARADILSRVENVVGTADSSALLSDLNSFFNAWSTLASHPGDSTARLQVRAAGDSLAGTIRRTYTGFDGAKTNLQTEISATLDKVQELADTIARLNKAIRSESVTGATPNDLLDQRDLALEELSGLIGVQSYPQSDGTVIVHSGSMPIVDGAGAYSIPRVYDTAAFTLSDGTSTFRFTGGKLYGLMESANQLDAYKAQLDAFAADLRDQVNLLHQSGIAANGATNVEFFAVPTSPGASAASSFALGDLILADTQNIAAGTSGNAGDGGLALALSQMRDQPNAALGSRTYSTFISDFITILGHDVAVAASGSETRQALIAQIEQQRQSVSGVSLDDEMANMMRLQRSYQAAAKALTLMDQVTEDLINMVR